MNRTNKNNRRHFLKVTAAGLAGATLLPQASEAKAKKDDKIIYRTLGRTGIKLPIVSMGAMKDATMIKAGLTLGVRHFDTAHVYQKGKNETMLGEALKGQDLSQLFTVTKVVPDDMDRQTGLVGEGCTAESFLKMFDTSLERLQVKSVDLLYVHAVSTKQAVQHPEVLKAIKKAKEQGKCKFLGVSTHKNEPEVIRAAIDAGIYDVVLTAYNFKQDHIKELNAAIAEGVAKGLGFVAMKTMAGGFLDKDKTKAVNTKAALKWAMQNENICTSIPSVATIDQLEESWGIMEKLKLTKEEERDLEFARDYAGLYCNACNQCDGQCRKNLPIPEIMRSYMYTYGYRDMGKAKELLANMGVVNDPCSDCGDCTVSCVKQFAVGDKVKAVSRLMDVPDEFIV
ncbi:aldo/keto reductase [Carboxylicivirga sediminis]|uniref:Aldo/keto reductase n=1 Tax=Carboxylicivirga sediminis TaxID=2006564 RepID=A0A941F7R6_9BACT|nr:aldo/keto reductase [Carboxylicivirga sediminis]MBR8537962.1 aldo/keto reductase [Carboxylicivirga sediminis]